MKVTLTNEILSYITEIEHNRYKVSSVKLSKPVMNRLRKNSKKKSSYASNKNWRQSAVGKTGRWSNRARWKEALSETGAGSAELFSRFELSWGKSKQERKIFPKAYFGCAEIGGKRVLPRRKSDSGDPCLPGCCLPCMIPRREILIIFHRNIATYRSFLDELVEYVIQRMTTLW